MEEISLFTPGPTHIPTPILQAMSISELHHRTSEFRKMFQETAESLQRIVQASEPPLFLACSGSGVLEAIVANNLSPTDHLGYLDAGKFGDRWGEIAAAKDIPHSALTLEWGDSPSVDEVRNFLREHPEITHFGVQYCETSTTVLHDVPKIAEMLKKEFPDILLFIDAISAATTLKIDLTELHWDALALASQKAFMLPPGLGMVFLSERYWGKAETVRPQSLYFDLKKERASQNEGNAAWTPTTSLIAGLRESIALFEKEGWDNVYARHAACRDTCYQWFDDMQIEPVNREHGSPSVTGGRVPSGRDPETLRKELQSKFGFRIAGGQDQWKGQVLRVGHMGIVQPSDIERCLKALSSLL